MNPKALERLEAAADRCVEVLEEERRRNRELTIRVAELEARLAKGPGEMEAVREENRRLARNTEIAAQKIEELLERL